MVNSHGLPQARDCSQHPQSAVTFQASLKPAQKFLLPSPSFIDEDFPGLRISHFHHPASASGYFCAGLRTLEGGHRPSIHALCRHSCTLNLAPAFVPQKGGALEPSRPSRKSPGTRSSMQESPLVTCLYRRLYCGFIVP